jgi:hypothetical protein
MRKALGITTAAAAVFMGLAISPIEAQPQDYPYCARQGGRNGYENCGYSTLEQCRASVSGVGGYCGINPRYAQRPYDDDDRAPPRRYRERRGY